jgi:hypothetical protein
VPFVRYCDGIVGLRSWKEIANRLLAVKEGSLASLRRDLKHNFFLFCQALT